MSSQEFCIAEATKFSRSLPFQDCLRFLNGLVLLAGDCPEIHELRTTIMRMNTCDKQLELIITGGKSK